MRRSTQPINDARALTAALRQDGFEVDVVEDANKEDMRRAVDRLKSKVRRDSVVMLFYGGYGIQAGRESYMIPVDAAIWKEGDVRRQGTSIESVLDALKERGARASLVVLDASRSNPFERRFRTYSHGLARDRCAAECADPVVGDTGQGGGRREGREQRAGHRTAEEHEQRKAPAPSRSSPARASRVSRNSDGQQVPTVSSSLSEEIRFGSSRRQQRQLSSSTSNGASGLRPLISLRFRRP